LIYLAEKYGRFLGDGAARTATLEWLMWQMGGFGPMLGQSHHFLQFNPGQAPYAEERFANEAKRLYGVLNTRLHGRDFIVDTLSIADFAIWPWASRFEWQRIDLNQFPNVKKWYLRCAEREAFQKGHHCPKNTGDIPMP
jgi:GST-like protein